MSLSVNGFNNELLLRVSLKNKFLLMEMLGRIKEGNMQYVAQSLVS